MFNARHLKQILMPYLLASFTTSILLHRPTKQLPREPSKSGNEVLALMHQGNILAKVTKWFSHPEGAVTALDNHAILMQNLVDLNLRIPVRPRVERQEGEIYYKLNLLTQEIETRTQASKEKISVGHTYTRKLSTTLIANLSTPLFDDLYNDTSWIPSPHIKIGVLFNLNKSIVCAMANDDFISYQRNYVSSNLDHLKAYAAYANQQDMFYKDINFFKSAIENQSLRSNEVLARVNADALEALFIEGRSEEGIHAELARQSVPLQIEIEKCFGKRVPILFYDPKRRLALEYDLETQKLDQLSHQLSVAIQGCAQYNHFNVIAGKNISSCEEAIAVMNEIKNIDNVVLHKTYRYAYMTEYYDHPGEMPKVRHPGFFFRYTDDAKVKKINDRTDLKPSRC